MIIAKKGDTGAKVRTIQRLLNLQVDGIFGRLTHEAVCDFQRENGLAVDGIVGGATWSKLLTRTMKKSRRTINEIIVHCTASKRGVNMTVEDIRRIHMKENGWSDIGYHYVVYLDGSVHAGRSVDIAGAHCTGHNTHSIGVCYVGGVGLDGKTPEDTRTLQQKDSLKMLLTQLRQLYPNAKIRGHRDFAVKACPSFDATREYSTI